jgi:hypothetical protein
MQIGNLVFSHHKIHDIHFNIHENNHSKVRIFKNLVVVGFAFFWFYARFADLICEILRDFL